tara:strand:+ start:16306 stop:16473 length:168 start_codon:yes stop_codon:yes gene_type:complete
MLVPKEDIDDLLTFGAFVMDFLRCCILALGLSPTPKFVETELVTKQFSYGRLNLI